MKNNGIFCAFIAVALCSLVGCNQKKTAKKQKTESTSVVDEDDDSKIRQIFLMYRESGGTLSYEEWLRTIKGEKGDPGQNGDAGPQGQPGKDGSTILSGAGIPSNNTGNTDDFYINTLNWDFYKKDTAGWLKIGNLKGEQGQTGSQGPQGNTGQAGQDGQPGQDGKPGKDGTSVSTGNGIPSSTLGNDGDSYINLLNWDYYVKENGLWVLKGNIKGDTGTGISVVSALVNNDGDLIIEFSNGESTNAGHVVDTDVYTVRFHVDDEIVATRNVIKGNTVDRPTEEETAGYTITDWYYLDGTKQESWKFFGYVVTTDIDLYAEFSYNAYTINYIDNQFGYVISPSVVYYDNEFDFPNVSKKGYSVARWEDENGKNYSDEGTYRLTHDLTLYVVWVAKTYEITLLEGGENCPSSVTMTYDSPYELPIPEKEGYVFTGWYYGNQRISGSSIWTRASAISLTAHWTNVTMTFTFDCGEGSCETESMVILYDESYQLPYPTPSSDEYLFVGWTLDGELIPIEGTWTYSTVGKILFAKWERHADLPSVNQDRTNVLYGEYPQTRVDDADLISSLSSLPISDENKYLFNDDYYSSFYCEKDIVEQGPLAALVAGTTYWYKWEPINWKIISMQENIMVVITTKLLEQHIFSSINTSLFEDTDIYHWLTGTFKTQHYFENDSYFTYLSIPSTTINYPITSKLTDWARAHGAWSDYEGVGHYWTTGKKDYKVYYNTGHGISDNPVSPTLTNICVRPYAKLTLVGY